MVAAPEVAFAVTRPVAFTEAIAELLDAHVAVVVTFCVAPLLYTAVADICCVSPAAIDGFDGEIRIDVTTGADDVNVTDELTEPTVAVTLALPCAPAVTRPVELTEATPLFELAYVAALVSFCVEPSLKFPVTVSCCVSPDGTLGFAGVIVSETSTGAETVKVAEPETAPYVAVIVDVPCPDVFTSPAGDTLATAVFDEDQFTVEVRSCVELSEKVPVAVTCVL
jgi:hypothetical protein